MHEKFRTKHIEVSLLMSKLVIFGGAGRTGREVVNQALTAGHEVTAFCFSEPPEGTFIENGGLTIQRGNAYNYSDVASAVQGKDAVINIIAPRLFDNKNYPISEIATKNIIAAMESCNVKRYIGQAGAWATDQFSDASPLMQIGFKIFLPLKHVYSYKKKEDIAVKQSNLDWTLVRCGVLTDKEPIADYRVFRDHYKCRLFEIPKIRRSNVAAFELSILNDTSFYHTCPIIIE